MDLTGKVALVTGANSGIGFETSLALAKRGATVVLACRENKAEDTANLIRSMVPGAKVEPGPPLDLKQQSSVRAFVELFSKTHSTLDILVNNAGVAYTKKEFIDGVGSYAQINHLGAYTLTRLLESTLVKSKARVVTVSSITHRFVRIKDVSTFFSEFKTYYQHTKLANALFAFELQRRLGNRGLTSVAVDPGAVDSSVWDTSPAFKKGNFKRTVISWFYAPPSDGAKSVTHAATVDWEKERKKKDGTPVMPAQDIRYYARGLFASPGICKLSYFGITKYPFLISCAFGSMLDWPLRRLSGGYLGSWVGPCRPSKEAADEKLAAELWDLSADVAKLPRQPQV